LREGWTGVEREREREREKERESFIRNYPQHMRDRRGMEVTGGR